MNKELIFLEEIKPLTEEIWGVNPKYIDSTIRSLRGSSEEIDRFMYLFSQKYDVNMEEYDYYDYFYEDQFIIQNIFRDIFLILGILKRKNDLTFRHLFKIRESGVWANPFYII